MPSPFFPFGAGSSTPVTFFIGPGGSSSAVYNVTQKVDLASVQITETGNHESATCDFAWLDKTFALPSNRGEWRIAVQHGSSVIFRGYITNPTDEWVAIYGKRAVSAVDIGVLLDRLIIDPAPTPPKRTASEGMLARLAWLFTIYGQPFMAEGLDISTYTQTLLSGNMPDQKFQNLTLRQGLERILSVGDATGANYYIDSRPALHTFDDANPEAAGVTNAPYDINSSAVLASSPKQEIAPETLSFDWDSSNLVNYYSVRGNGATESFSDPASIATFGERMNYLDAPDADTHSKRQKVAYAALRDTRNPIPQGSFVVEGANCFNGSTRWQAGQLVYVTSTAHGLNGRNTDAGPWISAGVGGTGSATPLQPLRVVHLSTSYLDGSGNRRMEVEVGGRRRKLFGGD